MVWRCLELDFLGTGEGPCRLFFPASGWIKLWKQRYQRLLLRIYTTCRHWGVQLQCLFQRVTIALRLCEYPSFHYFCFSMMTVKYCEFLKGFLMCFDHFWSNIVKPINFPCLFGQTSILSLINSLLYLKLVNFAAFGCNFCRFNFDRQGQPLSLPQFPRSFGTKRRQYNMFSVWNIKQCMEFKRPKFIDSCK